MPVSPTYPGVYIEEVPSSVRTISGVATSITAFVGRALRGPIDKPLRISSWGDFERKYGGLWRDSTLSYAVQQYYQNGGVDAVIVRLASGAATPAALASTATGTETWTFQATEGGAAGNSITIAITTAASDPTNTNLFDITISNGVDPDDVVVDVDLTTLNPGDSIGANGWITVEGAIPPLRPNAVAAQSLTNGADAATATATLSGETFTAATTGAGGNLLRASVSAATDTDPLHYNLLIELLDDDGDLLASALYENVVPGGAWPAAPTLVGTTDHLLDTISNPNAPATRPADGTAPFTLGSNVERASATVGITVTTAGLLPLVAASPGRWGNSLQAAFDLNTNNTTDTDLFNVIIREVNSGGTEVSRETFRNVSVNAASSRFVKSVLEEQSQLVRLATAASYTRPPGTAVGSSALTWLSFTSGSDGAPLTTLDYTPLSGEANKAGIYRLELADLFNLLVIPPPTPGTDTAVAVWSAATTYCKARRAMLIVDAPVGWVSKDNVTAGLDGLGLSGNDATNAAIYWPQIQFADPLQEFRLAPFPAGGAVAGIMARTDSQRGVWKAPAGIDATISGARGLSVSTTDLEQGQINPLGVNVLRAFPVIGTVVWGARTLRGSDMVASEWKYVPVRRLALYIEESLYRGSKWAVFEGNDERLWAQLRLNIGSFMQNLFRQGAFQGTSARDAYLVKCDAETTTQSDIDRGVVNVVVGFLPLKPAEFVILKISQLAGQAGA
jgi:phage tail sheath protein FI